MIYPHLSYGWPTVQLLTNDSPIAPFFYGDTRRYTAGSRNVADYNYGVEIYSKMLYIYTLKIYFCG